jgi:glycosyltransferase involved in cell wall biosynthesis
MELSIISPIYKGELMLDELISRIECSVRNLVSDYEINLVNDASPDNSWNVIMSDANDYRNKAFVKLHELKFPVKVEKDSISLN